MTVSIILPVSRPDFLQAVFTSLEMLACDRQCTNLICLVDGDAQLFLQTREFVQNSKLAEKLCIQRNLGNLSGRLCASGWLSRGRAGSDTSSIGAAEGGLC